MRRGRVLLAAVIVVAFGGCVVTGPEIRVKPPVEIKAEPAGTFLPSRPSEEGQLLASSVDQR